jgi:hypothetical protein
MLSFIPDSLITLIVHLIFTIGVIGFFIGSFASKFPFISTYGNIIKIVAGILLIAGLYLEGGIGVEQEWRSRVTELQDKIEVAQKESKKENIVIREKVVEKVRIIKEKSDEIRTVIETKRDAINAECKLSDDAWVLYNRATQNAVSGSTGKSDGKVE